MVCRPPAGRRGSGSLSAAGTLHAAIDGRYLRGPLPAFPRRLLAGASPAALAAETGMAVSHIVQVQQLLRGMRLLPQRAPWNPPADSTNDPHFESIFLPEVSYDPRGGGGARSVVSRRRRRLALFVFGCGAGLACARAHDPPGSGLSDGGGDVGTEASGGTGGGGAGGPGGSGGAMGGTGGATERDAGADMVLFDDFLGSSIDAVRWTVVDRISDQANGEIDCNVAANVNLSGGVLLGLSRFEDHTCGDSGLAPSLHHYTSWNMQQRTAPFLYGTIAVRAKLPGGIGVWPAIWMLGYKWQPSQAATANVPGADWPHDGWCEVDIAEFMGNARDRVNNTVHFNVPGGTHEAALPFDATTRYMVYRLQWSPGSLVWSVDAEDGAGFRTLRTVTGSASVPDVPMYLVLNAAIGGIGGGTPNPATFPQTFSVDWVRVTR